MKIQKELYLSHIQNNKKIFKMNNLLDKIQITINKNIVSDTDFYDPYEQYLALSILNRFEDISYNLNGGYKDAERNTFQIYPSYLDTNETNRGLSCLLISDIDKDIRHKDLLGSILSLGIKREKIGDIILGENYSYLIIKEEVKDYIIYNLERVANKKVQLREINFDQVELLEKRYEEIYVFLTSLRLDSLISSAYKLRRKESLKLISRGDVKVNWKETSKAGKEIKPGDTISVMFMLI